MNVVFSKWASADYDWWQEHDGRGFEKINDLIRGIRRDPHGGLGKPEPLKENLSGGGHEESPRSTAWSTRSKTAPSLLPSVAFTTELTAVHLESESTDGTKSGRRKPPQAEIEDRRPDVRRHPVLPCRPAA
ncbi:MAG: type II toxin-antitoxin system YoeB family toxin [Sulfuricella sp.]|nr:type II toxin-antitoxin system YoeB family toxin [Sulfuricella sp.]